MSTWTVLAWLLYWSMALNVASAYSASDNEQGRPCGDAIGNDNDALGDARNPGCFHERTGNQSGSLFISANVGSTANEGRVFEFDAESGQLKGVLVGPFGPDMVQGMTLGPDHHLYLSLFDSTTNQNGRVMRYDLRGRAKGAFVEAGSGGLQSPVGLRFGPGGDLYVTSNWLGLDKVLRYDGKDGNFQDALAANLLSPQEIVFGPDGLAYVSNGDSFASSIYRYDPVTADYLGPFVASGAGGLRNPTGMAFGADHHLYVVSFPNNAVFKFDGLTGDFISEFASLDGLGVDTPTDLVFGPDGNLYVVARSGSESTVVRFDGETGAFIDVFIDGASVGLGVSNTGMLFVDSRCSRFGDYGFANRCFSPGKRSGNRS